LTLNINRDKLINAVKRDAYLTTNTKKWKRLLTLWRQIW